MLLSDIFLLFADTDSFSFYKKALFIKALEKSHVLLQWLPSWTVFYITRKCCGVREDKGMMFLFPQNFLAKTNQLGIGVKIRRDIYWTKRKEVFCTKALAASPSNTEARVSDIHRLVIHLREHLMETFKLTWSREECGFETSPFFWSWTPFYRCTEIRC